MSLQVWLPLNGTLTNNGFHSASISQVGSTLGTSNGKVTSVAYNWTVDGQGISLNGFMNTFRTYTNYSISAWVYYSSPATNHSTSICSSGNWNTGAGQLCFGFYSHNGSGYTKLLVPNKSSWDWGIDLSSPLVANKWYHVTATYGDGITKGYINGEYVGSLSTGGITDQSETSNLHIGRATYYDGFTIKGCINDFRIYDHVLSAKEIKEMSRGLVAHYQLKGMGRTNYMKGASKYTKDNPLIRNATDSSVLNDSYIYYDLSDLSITVPTDGTYTLVLEADGVLPSNHSTGSSSASERRLGIFLQNTSSGNHYFWENYGTGSTGEVYGSFSLPAGTYKFRTNLYANDKVNYRVAMWNLKFVQGGYDPNDVWCPNSEDALYNALGVGSSILTDSSGYGNNLTLAGTIPMSGGSPRYGSCVDFNQTGYLKKTNFNMTTNQFTLAFWLNPPYTINAQHFICGTFNSWTGNGFGMWRDSTGGGYSLLYKSNSEGSYTGFPGITPTHDTWSHIAIVYTGTQGIVYLNGTEAARVDGGSSGTVSHPVLYLGNSRYSEVSSQTDEACMSDFRFYATALSAGDITELYKHGASITNTGAVLAYDFHENKRNTVDKNGIVATGGFNDRVCPTYDMKPKVLEDGSTWARIHYLDLTYDKSFFASASEVAKCINKSNRYSRMGVVDSFKSSPSLPTGYTELEYIQSSGTQYIDTGVVYSNTKSFRTKMRYSYTTTAPANQIHGFTGNRGMGIGTDGTTWWECTAPTSVSAGTLYEIDWTLNNNGEYDRIINGNHNAGTGGGGHSGYSGHMYLFTAHESATASGFVPSYMCQSKLYYTQIYENGVMVRNFVPCKNPSGTVGLYDLVEKKFYANAGSGTFTAGTFVSKYEFMLTYPQVPLGYTELEYIESTGTQYISTGFKPNQNTRVVIDVEIPDTGIARGLYGSRAATASQAFVGFARAEGTQFNFIYGSSSNYVGSPTGTTKGRFLIDHNKNSVTVNGTTSTLTATSNFQSPNNMFIMAVQSTGALDNQIGSLKLYSCKLYDNGTLIRDFVPCMSASGEVGLYDRVTKVFYKNAGTGKFIAGSTKAAYNRWTQTSSPNATSVTGYNPISISWSAHSAGIRKHGSSCLYNCDSGDTWYAPIGQYSIWEGGIPAADGTPQAITELWVRTDKASSATQAKIYDGAIVAQNYIEL